MDMFTAWAVLLFAEIVIVGLISLWRASYEIMNVFQSGVSRASGWIGSKLNRRQ